MEEYKIPYKYVCATFEDCDLEERVEKEIIDYLRENDLFDTVVEEAAEWLREYFAYETDPYWEAIRDSLEKVVGREKLSELDEYGDYDDEEEW